MPKRESQQETEQQMEKMRNEADKEFQQLMKQEIEVYAPTLSLKEFFENNEILTVTVKDWPKPVAFQDTEEIWQNSMVLTVEYAGIDYSMWLSAESLKKGVVKAFQDYGDNLIGREIAITRREYRHKKYGDTFAYNVSVQPKIEQQDMTEY